MKNSGFEIFDSISVSEKKLKAKTLLKMRFHSMLNDSFFGF